MQVIKFGKNNQGQALLEAIVAFGVVALVLVALISAITVSLANAQYARNKAQATKYAQEAIEWLHQQRDTQTTGWSGFYTKAGATYCVNNLSNYSSMTASSCSTNMTGTIFEREMTLTGNVASDKVTALINVTWTQGARTAKVDLETVLTKW